MSNTTPRGQGAAQPPPHKVGRPPGEPSTIINLRIPVDLLAQLDHYIDRLEVQTGLKANRGMMMRRALALFLETHFAGNPGRGREERPREGATPGA